MDMEQHNFLSRFYNGEKISIVDISKENEGSEKRYKILRVTFGYLVSEQFIKPETPPSTTNMK